MPFLNALSEAERKEMTLKSFNYTEVFKRYYDPSKQNLSRALVRFQQDLQNVAKMDSARSFDGRAARYQKSSEGNKLCRLRILEAYTLSNAINHSHNMNFGSITSRIKQILGIIRPSVKCDEFIGYLENVEQEGLKALGERNPAAQLSAFKVGGPEAEQKIIAAKSFDFMLSFNRYYEIEKNTFGESLLKLSKDWHASSQSEGQYRHSTRYQSSEAANMLRATNLYHKYPLGTVVKNIKNYFSQINTSVALEHFLRNLKLREDVIAKMGVRRYTNPFKHIFHRKDNPLEWLDAIEELTELYWNEAIDRHLEDSMMAFIEARQQELFTKLIPKLLLKQGTASQALKLLDDIIKTQKVPVESEMDLELLAYSLSILPPSQDLHRYYFSGQYILPKNQPVVWFRQLMLMFDSVEKTNFNFISKDGVFKKLDEAYARLFASVIPRWVLYQTDLESFLEELDYLKANITVPNNWKEMLPKMAICLTESIWCLFGYHEAGSAKNKYSFLKEQFEFAQQTNVPYLPILKLLLEADKRRDSNSSEDIDIHKVYQLLRPFQTESTTVSASSSSSSELQTVEPPRFLLDDSMYSDSDTPDYSDPRVSGTSGSYREEDTLTAALGVPSRSYVPSMQRKKGGNENTSSPTPASSVPEADLVQGFGKMKLK